MRTYKVERKMVPKSVAQRRNWAKFGMSTRRMSRMMPCPRSRAAWAPVRGLSSVGSVAATTGPVSAPTRTPSRPSASLSRVPWTAREQRLGPAPLLDLPPPQLLEEDQLSEANTCRPADGG